MFIEVRVGTLKSRVKVHVIDSHPPYHLLLGRPWTQHFKAVSSSYYQCVKALLGNTPVHIDAVSNPFEVEEAYFTDAGFYRDFDEDGETSGRVSSSTRSREAIYD